MITSDLYGCMLLLLDVRIAGPCRERLIVAYYRYKGAGTIPNVDAVVKLCRSTGYVHSTAASAAAAAAAAAAGKKPVKGATPPGEFPPHYPEDYFHRFRIPQNIGG